MDVDVETVVVWGGELGVLQGRLRPYFARCETRQRAMAYINGLLSDIPRKNGWQLTEQAGENTPDGNRHITLVMWTLAYLTVTKYHVDVSLLDGDQVSGERNLN